MLSRSTRFLNSPDPLLLRRFSARFASAAPPPPPPMNPATVSADADSPPLPLTDSAAADSSPPPPIDLAASDFVHVSASPPSSPSAADPDPAVVSARSFPEDPTAPSAADSGGVAAEEEEREAGPELSSTVVQLQCESSAEGGTCKVYIVGTAHVSQESCREVQEAVRLLKPQVVFLELCPSRVNILTPQNLKVPTVSEMIDMWKKNKGNTFGIVYGWFLAKVADKLDVFPGAEFRVAFEEARSYGAKVILGDRPVNITLRRTWLKMPLWHRAKFMFYILFQSIFLPSPEELNKMMKEMDDVDMLTLVIQEMSKEFPTLMETLLRERDLYMSSTLLKVAKEHSSVVAVVGKGHVSGIKKHWNQPIEVKHLLEIPTRSEGISRKKILAIAVAATGVAVAFFFAGKR